LSTPSAIQHAASPGAFDVFNDIVKLHLSSEGLAGCGWRCRNVEYVADEKMYVVWLECPRSTPPEDWAREVTSVKDAVVFSESLLGRLVRVQVRRSYVTQKRFWRDSPREFSDGDSYKRLSKYLGGLPTLPRCRLAIGNLISMLGVLSVFACLTWKIYSTDWPSMFGPFSGRGDDRRAVMLCLIVASLRILLGINYLSFDRTLNELVSLSQPNKIRLLRIGRIVLQVSTAAVPISFVMDSAVILWTSLFFISVVPMLYLGFFNKEFLADEEWYKNIMFYINDFLFFFIAICLCVGYFSTTEIRFASGFIYFWSALVFVEGLLVYWQSIVSVIILSRKYCSDLALR
jgi:hypothetical protein